MNYERFVEILNQHIFMEGKRALLKNLAEHPERFIGLFRPTRPRGKILQHILQSHEIKFGDALEEIMSEFLRDWDYDVLPKIIFTSSRKRYDIDQYFRLNDEYFFIEQKVRDDHDSSKREGQIRNFEVKLEYVYDRHGDNLRAGYMWFIDPDFHKNRDYYLRELQNMRDTYGVELHLLYGKELFDEFNHGEDWDTMLEWLGEWKNNLPEIPEINFDMSPEETFREIRDLEKRYWRKILTNDQIWDEGLMQVIFGTGETLDLICNYFNSQSTKAYRNLGRILREKLDRYYGD